MSDRYSKRIRPIPDNYRYVVPQNVRWRFLHTMGELSRRHMHSFDLEGMFDEVEQIALRDYGSLCRSQYDAANVHDDRLLNHVLICSDEKFLDFLEFCFRTRMGCGEDAGVKEFNRIFEDEAIGFELTAWKRIYTDEPARLFGRLTSGKSFRIEFPQIISKDEQFTHREIVQPCLAALSNPKMVVANSEMLAALTHYRHGRYADSLTSCGSAFESVLKTICRESGWPFDPDKDTCSKLVSICRDNGLFAPFYSPIFETSGTIRNKLGDAHGRGPSATYIVTKEHVDHMIQMTSAHITFLIRLARL